MRKFFILDTNVLLHDPESIFKFQEHMVCIPLVCVEELDRFKREQNENGRNARHFARIVDSLRQKGPLSAGVDLGNKGKLCILVDAPGHDQKNKDWPLDLSINDNKILLSAIRIKEKHPKDHIILISKDINLRLKADVLDIQSEDYTAGQVGKREEHFAGLSNHHWDLQEIEKFEKERSSDHFKKQNYKPFPNEYFIIDGAQQRGKRALARYCGEKNTLVPIIPSREGMWGIHPKNCEQQFAFDALLNEKIRLVTLAGKAGTGKTLLAIAAGLELTVGQERYARVLISRPVQPLGRDIGYLPGDVDEKLAPWMRPIYDNIDFLFGIKKGERTNNRHWEHLVDRGLLHVEPLTYIRGRSIPGQFLIVDEAQNLSPHELKTIITRAGEGTKIVLTGDCEQIDNPYLDSVSNGLVYCIERLKDENLVAHMNLLRGERSALSEIATKKL